MAVPHLYFCRCPFIMFEMYLLWYSNKDILAYI